MAFLDKVVEVFYRTKKEPQLNEEIVSTVGLTNFYTLLDKTVYNPDDISLEVYDRIYKNHQAKACLNIIRFSLQQIDWFIKSDDPEVQKVVTFAMERIWNKLLKAVSKSFRYGFSASVKVFTLANIEGKQYIIYDKIRDLDEKYCDVKVDEYGNYNGFIYRKNTPEFKKEIDPKYSFWFTNDMEAGNLYGNSMLKDVYKPWYFSEKVHQYANRYYERFGEPLVVGRAPSGSSRVKDKDGKVQSSQDLMATVIDSIRSHSSAQLPSDKDAEGKNYLYDISYLESQMRGFDFDNYLKRLDMEITRGLLVPDLMFQSGSGGSYALGSAQIEAFYTNLMGIMDNVVDYVNLYIIPQLVEYNFGEGKSAKIAYQPLSVDSRKFINEMINNLITNGRIMPDMDQIQERSGFKFTEEEIKPDINVVTKDQVDNKIKKEVSKNNAEITKSILLNAELIAKKTVLDKEIEETKNLRTKLEEIDE